MVWRWGVGSVWCKNDMCAVSVHLKHLNNNKLFSSLMSTPNRRCLYSVDGGEDEGVEVFGDFVKV